MMTQISSQNRIFKTIDPDKIALTPATNPIGIYFSCEHLEL